MREEISAIVAEIIASSNTRLRLENDGSGTTIKFDNRRLGRDVEVYAFMGKVAGRMNAWVSFLEEVLMPIKSKLPDAYRAGATMLLDRSLPDCQPHLKNEWRELCV